MREQPGYEVTLNLAYEPAIETVIAALKTEGFGILTRIDVRATLKEKLGVEFRPYIILGACNPPLAHRALSQAPELGLMLPCNVTVESVSSEQSLVRIANPAAMLSVTNRSDDPELKAVADLAVHKMENVTALLQNRS
jgi:uncharacterized protein (DUF302 family)